MKHIKYILIPALTGFFFTACNTEPAGPSQAELDAQVETKVKAATDQLKAECDTRLLQAAQMQADSIIAKAAGKKVAPAPNAAVPAPVKPKTPATVKPKTPPTPPAPPKNPKEDRFNRTDGKKTVTEENTKKKEDRFDGGEKKSVTPEDTKRKADRFK